MTENDLGILRFEEAYFERIWGGRKLASVYDKPLRPEKPIGEAWLISDHRVCESRVRSGPQAGRTLRDLLQEDPQAVLGTRAALTVHERFPLLLKLLDAQHYLSVQVHPDDDCARRLNELDTGKTEMWYVLHADAHSELACGLRPGVSREAYVEALKVGGVEELLQWFGVQPGSAVFVPAGTVHAIGPGVLLAEIQQNSDLTYRIYDWGRVGPDGKPRELHLEKALEAIRFGSIHPGVSRPLAYEEGRNRRTVLAACRYFAAELVEVSGSYRRDTRGESFHILLVTRGELVCRAGNSEERISPGEARLVPAHFDHFEVEGAASFLEYYLPDLAADIVAPLLAHGLAMQDIAKLGKDLSTGKFPE